MDQVAFLNLASVSSPVASSSNKSNFGASKGSNVLQLNQILEHKSLIHLVIPTLKGAGSVRMAWPCGRRSIRTKCAGAWAWKWGERRRRMEWEYPRAHSSSKLSLTFISFILQGWFQIRPGASHHCFLDFCWRSDCIQWKDVTGSYDTSENQG